MSNWKTCLQGGEGSNKNILKDQEGYPKQVRYKSWELQISAKTGIMYRDVAHSSENKTINEMVFGIYFLRNTFGIVFPGKQSCTNVFTHIKSKFIAQEYVYKTWNSLGATQPSIAFVLLFR